MPITEMQSFISQTPTQFSIQAVEKSEVFAIDFDKMQMLYDKYDSFKTFGLRLTERILSKAISRATSLQFESPETRYQKLFENQIIFPGFLFKTGAIQIVAKRRFGIDKAQYGFWLSPIANSSDRLLNSIPIVLPLWSIVAQLA